eukprot:gene5555-5971_t
MTDVEVAVVKKEPSSSKKFEKSFEDKSSWFSYVFFLYLNPIFEKGDQLEHVDLGATSLQDRCDYLHERFQKFWQLERQLAPEKRSLWKVLWRTSGYERLFLGLLLYTIYQAESFGPIIILNLLVKYFQGNQDLNDTELGVLVALIFVLPMTASIFAAHSNAIFAHIGMQFRNILINMIYRKSLRLSPAARQVSSTGQIINMFSNDTTQLQRFLYFFNNMALALPTIAVCLWLIYQQMEVATFVGLGLILIIMPLNGVIFGGLNMLRRKKVLITDIRVKLMNEILSGIRIIKYYAWEKAFSEKVSLVRDKELDLLKISAYIVAIAFTIILQAVPVFLPVLIFFTYVQLGNTLDAARAFTSIALFNLMQMPFIFLPMGLSQYSQSLVSCKRILEFLDADELVPYVDSSKGENGVVIEMTGANLGWVLENEIAGNSTLKDSKITLEAIETHASKSNSKAATTSLEGKKYAKLEKGEGDAEAAEGKDNDEDDIELADMKNKEAQAILDEEAKGLVNRSINTLRSASFQVKQGELVAVIGSVGSGKSSILAALLGEMHLNSGFVRVHGEIAFCDQRPWILNDTVQGNILFGKPYDEHKFDRALFAANLEDDIKVLPGGINTQIGERGINLSGGQKARVALARAVYQDSDIYLLDDPLSAVDAHVGQFLFQECIKKALKGKTRILVTHHVHFLPQCDKIVILHEGEVRFFGNHEDLIKSGLDLSSFVKKKEEQGEEGGEEDEMKEGDELEESNSEKANLNHDLLKRIEGEEEVESQRIGTDGNEANERQNIVADAALVEVSLQEPSASRRSEGEGGRERKPSVSSSKRDAQAVAKAAADERKKDNRSADLMTKEERKTGDVEWSIYSYYIKAGGVFWFSSMGFFVILGQLFGLLASYWLQWWGTISVRRDDQGDPLGTKRNMYYLNIYAALSAVSLVAYCFRSVILAKHRLGTSKILHDGLIRATLEAPVAFFDTTPIGRILNRFSSDLVVVDEELTQTISQFSNCVAQVLGSIGAIAGSTKGTFLVVFVPLMYIYNRFQQYFRSGNTTVARLESVSRSPIYADFSQALAGVNSIRAYKQETRFIEKLETALNTNSVANIFQQLSTQWLSIRLDFIGSIISFFIALLAVTATDFIPAGFVAVGLSYSFQLTSYLKFLVRVSATGEAQMNSVERIKFYMDNIAKEGLPDREIDPKTIPTTWPEKGTIVAKNLEMRYRDGPLVLKGIDFSIEGKEKIGVAGRTGSGKSSLMVALFRIQELAGGSLSIDNIDISTVPLDVLRKKLGIIPQDPVMFSASIRFNLDPFREFKDEDLWNVLDSVNIKEHVLSLPKKLEEEVSEGGDNFSAGQRQLICIARAILRKPKILVLDEATASIDNETDNLIQSMIRKEFTQCTVLTIAHRLNTIIDSDRVMVLDQGKLMELASPKELLEKSDGMFKGLWERHLKSHGNDAH